MSWSFEKHDSETGPARIRKQDKHDSETGMSADSETVIRKLEKHDSETGPARIPKRGFLGGGLKNDLES